MEKNEKWKISQQEKDDLIYALTKELVMLRTKAEISQEELSALVGISRQTYGVIERGLKKMSWNTFLSLVYFYSCNKKTRKMLNSIGGIQQTLLKAFNCGRQDNDISLKDFLNDNAALVIENLDEQAIHSIRTMIMVEYARCTSTPGESVLKSFDGIDFTMIPEKNEEARKAFKAIKGKKSND